MTLQRYLGDSGRQVSAIGLGAMPLSLDDCPDTDMAVEVVSEFVAGGGDFIDTANVYCRQPDAVGANERLIARALAERPHAEKVIVATKGGVRRTLDGWAVDASPQWLRESCDQSLLALGVDCLFLYQLHAPDPDVDIRESVAALERLREVGKIQYIGLSNVTVADINAAREVAPITSVQNALHPRRKEALCSGVVEHCRSQGITFIAHSPVGGFQRRGRLHDDTELQTLAERYATTPACLSLAWLLHLGPHVLPIPGARSRESVRASRTSLTITLAAEDVASINTLADW